MQVDRSSIKYITETEKEGSDSIFTSVYSVVFLAGQTGIKLKFAVTMSLAWCSLVYF